VAFVSAGPVPWVDQVVAPDLTGIGSATRVHSRAGSMSAEIGSFPPGRFLYRRRRLATSKRTDLAAQSSPKAKVCAPRRQIWAWDAQTFPFRRPWIRRSVPNSAEWQPVRFPAATPRLIVGVSGLLPVSGERTPPRHLLELGGSSILVVDEQR